MRILIADDDPLILALLSGSLQSAGHDVVAHDNGNDACEALARGGIRLTILDWDMPGMTGPEICRRLLLGGSANFIYAIILTAKKAAGNLDIALDSGASDFITKPFRIPDLLARVRAGQRLLGMQAQLTLAESQKHESIGRLAAGIAHEINTPTQYVGDNTRFLQEAFESLRGVLLDYEVLLRALRKGPVQDEEVGRVEAAVAAAEIDYLVEEIPQAIRQTLEGISRVSDIVRAMKDFSHPDTPDKILTNLNRAIQSTLTVARNEWKYVADLVTDFDAQLPHVPCLPGPLNQAVLSIVINAAHAIGDVVATDGGKGTITVATRRDGEWAEIRIGDSGTGIPKEVRDSVFDQFFTTKEVGRGTGQGLAVARSVIVEKHGGTIKFETEVGRGTTFIVRLPLEPPEAYVTAKEQEYTGGPSALTCWRDTPWLA